MGGTTKNIKKLYPIRTLLDEYAYADVSLAPARLSAIRARLSSARDTLVLLTTLPDFSKPIGVLKAFALFQ